MLTSQNKIAALKIQEDWEKGLDKFEFETSGTTGTPKIIHFNRAEIIWSCEQTKKLLNIQPIDKQLCVLPVSKTGGKMQVFRSLVWGIEINVESAEFLNLNEETVNNCKANILSLTPMLLWKVLQQPLGPIFINKFKAILIGGGDLLFEIDTVQFPNTRFIFTYGMTESLSHIATQEIGKEPYFKVLPETKVTLNPDDNTLKFRNYLTKEDWLQTNDVAEMLSETTFVIKGRIDNVINSGGLKIHPEQVEKWINSKIEIPVNSFFVGAKPDHILGQKLVLYYDTLSVKPEIFETLVFENKTWKPKEFIGVEGFEINEGNKINRVKSITKN